MVVSWLVIEHVDDIITLTYQYLNMLKAEGPKEWIFKECAVSQLFRNFSSFLLLDIWMA